MAKIKPENYVNNKDFTASVSEWVVRYKKAKAEDTELPPIPEYAADCFHKIAKRYCSKPNFSGYTYRDDMVSEAVLICIKYAHNFNPEKSNNAFAYFTQCCKNAFVQFIKKENSFAAFKFDLIKDAAPTLGKNDFKDINLFYDEDNTGIEELESAEADSLKTQVIPIEQILKEEK